MKKTILTTLLLSSLVLSSNSFADETEATPTDDESKSALVVKEISSQKISVQKVVTEKGQTLSGGKAISKLVGINGASFKVYDITDLMNETLEPYQKVQKAKGKLEDVLKNETGETNESLLNEVMKTSPTQNEFLDELKEKAQKAELSKLKIFAQGNTKTSNNEDGIFEFTVPIKAKTYNAYYIVNDKVDDNKATISDPTIIITPINDPETGLPLDVAFVYPKAQLIPKEEPPKKELPKEKTTLVLEYANTGIKGDWLARVVNRLR